MKIYKDMKSGDELVSDAFGQQAAFGDTAFDDVAFEVKARLIPKGEEDFGISRNTEEGEDTAPTAGVEMVINILENFQLLPVNLSKKELQANIKDLMKNVVERLQKSSPDRVDPFKKTFTPFFQEVLKRFADLEFYFGPNSLDGGTPVMAYYVGEETAPRFVFITDAMEVEKV